MDWAALGLNLVKAMRKLQSGRLQPRNGSDASWRVKRHEAGCLKQLKTSPNRKATLSEGDRYLYTLGCAAVLN